MKKTIHVTVPSPLPASYSILMQPGSLQTPAIWLRTSFKNIVIITDHAVKKKYAAPLVRALQTLGHQTVVLSFPPGEKSKNARNKSRLEESMLQRQLGRDTLIIALGGGVVGDLAGFIAATYMRGVPYIQVPTTLLAMVDSSIGGKTSIDTPQGKNLIGAFWQPTAVVADAQCLASLPKKHVINGLIEALKMFLTSDAVSFHFFIKKIDQIISKEPKALDQLIYRAIKIKTQIIEQDEREENLRRVLNFGHTIGHAIEKLTNYKLLHGFAVAYGILVEAKIAECLKILDHKHYQTIEFILSQLGITRQALKKFNFNIEHIIKATQSDKKVKTGKVYYVLLQDIGKVYEKDQSFAHVVPSSIVKKAWSAIIRG